MNYDFFDVQAAFYAGAEYATEDQMMLDQMWEDYESKMGYKSSIHSSCLFISIVFVVGIVLGFLIAT